MTSRRMTITAPFTGIIGISSLQAGDYLAVGNPIATIDDRSTILIEFTVPEAVASSMKNDMPVQREPRRSSRRDLQRQGPSRRHAHRSRSRAR